MRKAPEKQHLAPIPQILTLNFPSSGMTKEIAEAIDRALNPLGVGVIVEAAHMVS